VDHQTVDGAGRDHLGKTGRIDDADSIRGFIVPTTRRGFRQGPEGQALAARDDTSELVLQDVQFQIRPAAEVGRSQVTPHVPHGGAVRHRWGSVGAAMACYDEAVSYAKQRVMFGKPIGGFQLQQARLADMLTEITKRKLLCLQLGRLKTRASQPPASLARKRNNVEHSTRYRPGEHGACSRERHPGRVPGDAALANLESVYTYEGRTHPHPDSGPGNHRPERSTRNPLTPRLVISAMHLALLLVSRKPSWSTFRTSPLENIG